MGDSEESTVSVPKFDKVPWLSDASLRNKPLLLSLPQRYPHAAATFLISYKKDTNLPSVFQVPDDSLQARRKPDYPALVRSRQLCASCWEMRTAQPRATMIPDEQTLSFEASVSRRMKRLQPRKAQTAPKSSQDDISAGRETQVEAARGSGPHVPGASQQRLPFRDRFWARSPPLMCSCGSHSHSVQVCGRWSFPGN
ncbi:uncharacterized protein C1orf105 homolog isoform X1 [Phyllostomus hastatus]|uniref:uncharacterized protein C1orf105 homolog isoform X1 n=1 Tax=Phyllostomus hastatus TaxID=9423 RepID=UPI001E67ED94|nr:uncharacterized protein C1orf105 homolog isoform X1 [Phyllostomus hastatus]XP_045694571.1 uncharacterized protein C1orf105 homolog isoform X1 [Phyllostomus hastatus]